MRRSRPAVLIATALSVLAPGAAAEAAKVTVTAPGAVLPAATGGGGPTPAVRGEAGQSFKLQGRKVKKRRILDVNVVLNVTSGAPTNELTELRVTLVGPQGDNVPLPILGGTTWAGLKYDDQSNLFDCDPAFQMASNCSYLQGGTTYAGPQHAEINPTFRGLNPSGTWRLLFEDIGPGAEPPTTIGASTLEVKTGRRFAKG